MNLHCNLQLCEEYALDKKYEEGIESNFRLSPTEKHFQNFCYFVCLAYEVNVNVHLFCWNKKLGWYWLKLPRPTLSNFWCWLYIKTKTVLDLMLVIVWAFALNLISKNFCMWEILVNWVRNLFGDFGILMVWKIRCAKFRVEHFLLLVCYPTNPLLVQFFSRKICCSLQLQWNARWFLSVFPP